MTIKEKIVEELIKLGLFQTQAEDIVEIVKVKPQFQGVKNVWDVDESTYHKLPKLAIERIISNAKSEASGYVNNILWGWTYDSIEKKWIKPKSNEGELKTIWFTVNKDTELKIKHKTGIDDLSENDIATIVKCAVNEYLYDVEI